VFFVKLGTSLIVEGRCLMRNDVVILVFVAATCISLSAVEADASAPRTVVRLKLDAGRIRPARPRGGGPSDADYAQHIMDLKERLPSEAFSVVLSKPFVVIGDESPGRVRARAERTVNWATRRLKRQYFAKDPNDIIDIWLFNGKSSYRKYAWELFRDRPTTPFGYSSAEHRALVMNIATGGGTLVHEIVHPLMAANFPECPAWLNEGMGSLYEQSSDRNGRIVGMTNWRLAGLQKAIKKGKVPSFRTLLSSSEYEFYHEDPGTNYAQARYLCYYLQEKGVLERFYHQFHRHHDRDPTGYDTLRATLDEDNMPAFKKRWERFVLRLEFP